MTLEEAKKIAEEAQDWGWNYEPGDETVTLDGHFTPEQLEAIAMVVRADRYAVRVRDEVSGEL